MRYRDCVRSRKPPRGSVMKGRWDVIPPYWPSYGYYDNGEMSWRLVCRPSRKAGGN